MSTTPPVPPIEPTPPVTPAAPMTPPPPPAPPTAPAPPIVDPYGQATPPPAPGYAPAGYAPAGYAPAGYAPAYQPVGVYGAPPPQGLAVAALILGIAGAFFSFAYGLGLFPSIAAIITGHMARKRQPHAKGMALAGLICGYVGLGIAVLWIAGIIIFFVILGTNTGNYQLN